MANKLRRMARWLWDMVKLSKVELKMIAMMIGGIWLVLEVIWLSDFSGLTTIGSAFLLFVGILSPLLLISGGYRMFTAGDYLARVLVLASVSVTIALALHLGLHALVG